MTLKIARTIGDIRDIVAMARKDGGKIGLVPTMGGLHKGHLSLVKRATELCDHVIVSIFVNPTQFNKREDFENYPGNEAQDLSALEQTNAHSVFIPSANEMYPQDFSTTVTVDTGEEILCNAYRPGHFAGVATIVAKLFLQTGADIACFGEKDYQQLYTIRKLVKDLNIPIKIEPVATVRENDGLAMSSRNERLSEEERQMAPALFQSLQAIRKAIHDKQNAQQAIVAEKTKLEASGEINVEYLEMRSGETLELLDKFEPGARLFIAAHLGKVRLIDNIAV